MGLTITQIAIRKMVVQLICMKSLDLESNLIGLLKSLMTKIPCVIFVLKSL